MVLVQNNGAKPIKLIAYGSMEYLLVPHEIVEIPEAVATMYFGYNMSDITTEQIHWCCERLRFANPSLAQLSDKEIWDNVVLKISFNTEVEPIKSRKTRSDK